MIDPLTSLAFSIYENRGVYALLLGSGVSRAAEIPTGWEITLDLIRRVGRMEGMEEQPDWDAWYRSKYKKEPSYSDLLDALASTPDERRSILHSYIEPTAEEIEDAKKIPTTAHHAIAGIVRDGYIRVIVTTNFDRLLENALREAGVEPTVIGSDDAVKGAVPLIHGRCFVIKLHGDYLDTRIRNTEAELSGYSKAMNTLLNRVLDEHGLIVCGWSGDWDRAVRRAILRTPNRRYPLYWASRKQPTELAQEIIDHRAGRVITIEDADSFFGQLAEKLSVQAEIMRPDPRSVDLLVASAKRYLSGPHHRIQLADLVGDELRRAHAQLDDASFGAQGTFTVEEFVRRVNRYEAIAEPMIRLLSILARWGDDSQLQLATEVLRDLCRTEARNGLTVWIELSEYPAALALHSYGLGALHAGKYDNLFRWLTQDVQTRRGYKRTTIEHLFLFSWNGAGNDIWQKYPGLERHKTAHSDRLFELFQQFQRDYIVSDSEFEFRFELYETLGSLAHMTLKSSVGDLREAIRGQQYVWTPVGRVGWHVEIQERVLADLEDEGMRSQLLRAGFSKGDAEHFDLSLQNLRRIMSRVSW